MHPDPFCLSHGLGYGLFTMCTSYLLAIYSSYHHLGFNHKNIVVYFLIGQSNIKEKINKVLVEGCLK